LHVERVFAYRSGVSLQRSFDDRDGPGPEGPGTPLSEVTFVVLDLETTGGSPHSCAITEVGALKFRGGECVGTFQTLVNPGPGVRIPPDIVYLTGITEAMVAPAPPIDSVLPAFAEFIGDAVVVGHNVRFDLGFLRANLARLGYRPLPNRFVDTYALARRLVRDEVPNCKLSTLARHFRTVADPCHRALDDARATAEVFHHFLERVGSMGIVALDDLLALPTTAGHPQVAKLRWVAPLPRRPGVYLFKDIAGRVLYVGKATDLRRRVRSYFASDDRRKIGPLLREAASLAHIECVNDLEASVLEVRLIHRHAPRYNRQVKVWSKYRYVKLTLDDRFPRLAVVRVAKPGDGCLYLGPLSSAAAAKLAVEAIESAVPLRRCTTRITPRAWGSFALRAAPCVPAQLGVASCPCAGSIDADAYAVEVARVVEGLTLAPAPLLEPMATRMRALAASRRFEEAADVRDRASSLGRAIARQRRLESLVLAGRLEVELDDGGGAVIEHGRLVATWVGGAPRPLELPFDANGSPSSALPLAREDVDEVAVVASWLEARAGRARIVSADAGWAWPAARVPKFESTERPRAGRLRDVA
jgi:DNA polymerase-3 subunit epsilon